MKKLSLQERAARAGDRLRWRGKAWDNAHDGYLVGHRAAKRVASKELKTLRAQVTDLKTRLGATAQFAEIQTRRVDRLESALRAHARSAVDETRGRHPFKELRP